MIESVLLQTPEEKQLYKAYLGAKQEVTAMTGAHDYVGIMQAAAELSEPIDNFFNAVMVMVDDEKVRNNRLALLKAISGLTSDVIDLSKIVPTAK